MEKVFNTIQLGTSVSWADGFSEYLQLNPYLNMRLRLFKSLFLDFNYQYRFRKMSNNQEYKKYVYLFKIIL